MENFRCPLAVILINIEAAMRHRHFSFLITHFYKESTS